MPVLKKIFIERKSTKGERVLERLRILISEGISMFTKYIT